MSARRSGSSCLLEMAASSYTHDGERSSWTSSVVSLQSVQAWAGLKELLAFDHPSLTTPEDNPGPTHGSAHRCGSHGAPVAALRLQRRQGCADTGAQAERISRRRASFAVISSREWGGYLVKASRVRREPERAVAEADSAGRCRFVHDRKEIRVD